MRRTKPIGSCTLAFPHLANLSVGVNNSCSSPFVLKSSTNLVTVIVHRVGDTFFDSAGGVSIKVITIDVETSAADVEITASGNPRHQFYGPNTCRPGDVWREADPLDYTCVSPARRSAVWDENKLGPSRTLPNSLYCKQGFVWREAWPKDYVCVPYRSRSLAQEESRRAYKVVANDFKSTTLFAAGPLGPVIP